MRRLLIFAGAAVVLVVGAVVALVAVQMLRSDDPNLATEAPTIVAGSSTPGATGATGASTATTGLGSTAFHFTIDKAQSTAKYVVKESLRGLETTTVGVTSDVTGDIFLTKSGLDSSKPSSFKVDLRTLKTDENLRDNSVRSNTLNTNQFPFAEFTLQSIDGFPTNYTENQQVTLKMNGMMTIHGVTKPVSWTVLARQAGDTLTATADTDVKISDFGMTPPVTALAKSQDALHLQIILVAKQAA